MSRVLFVTSEIPSYRRWLFDALGRQFELTVLHSGKSAAPLSPIYREVRADLFGDVIKFQGQVRSLANSESFDVVVAMADIRWLSTLLLAVRRRRPRILGWGLRYGGRKWVDLVRGIYARRFDGHLLYSEHDLNRLVRSGINTESIWVAHNTLAVPDSEDCSRVQKDSIICVGRLTKRKAVGSLIDAFAKAQALRGAGVRLVVVGDGEERAALESKVRDLALREDVLFVGEISSESGLAPLFRRAWASVSCGAVGLNVLHSFSYGVPFLAVRGPYHGPESANIEEGATGRFVEASRLHIALDGIVECPTSFRRMGHAAYEHYHRRRSPDLMIKVFADALNGIPEGRAE